MFTRCQLIRGGAIVVASMSFVFAPAAAQSGLASSPEATDHVAWLTGPSPAAGEALVPELEGTAPPATELRQLPVITVPVPEAGPEEALQPQETETPRGLAMMAAGGALLFAGSFIDNDAGTIVMIGGAGMIAWGVYRLVR